ncbi:MAG: RluA family pseudouridine synthase [Christensenellales bacterium]
MLDIVFEDNHLLVIKKPFNVPTQADNSNDKCIVDMAKEYLKEKYNKQGNVYLGLVHRLDRPTGGLLILAKTSKAAERLTEDIKNHKVEKKYLAVLSGVPKDKIGHLENYLKKDEKTNTVKLATYSEEGSKFAELDYRVLEYNEKYSLVEIQLETGRSHQIRVQMSANKTPVFADFKYGKGVKDVNLALFAYKLQFTHPTTKKLMTFICEPPLDEIPWKFFSVQKHII